MVWPSEVIEDEFNYSLDLYNMEINALKPENQNTRSKLWFINIPIFHIFRVNSHFLDIKIRFYNVGAFVGIREDGCLLSEICSGVFNQSWKLSNEISRYPVE